jgi:predicted nucleic acid-binding protein
VSYLLDTCILSTLRKKSTVEGRKLREWISEIESSHLFVSVVTVGELQYGIFKLNEEHIKNALQEWLLSEVLPNFKHQILSVDQSICLRWGEFRAKWMKKGRIIPMADGLIAATAIHHELTLVTQNTKHFQDLDISILDPLR